MKKLLLILGGASSLVATDARAQSFRDRLPEDEIIYFLLPDRFENGDTTNDKGGLKGDRLTTGYDPTSKGFFHGGDLKGLTKRLDYIQGMGATAVWLSPVFKNKPVQGPKGQESAGYHGYWVTDFTRVDPHLGTDADFKAFVDAAHARGMKVYMDIIANHTADVLYPKKCEGKGECAYRGIADYPYQRRGGVTGAAINAGFDDSDYSKLTDPNFAYTVTVKPAEKSIKVPAWLNDPIYYHNRGDTTFKGESSQMGDFVGLDDLFTEHPRVVEGMIEIYGSWIDRFGVDGFRIDTAQHVNPGFWEQFSPAMIERAKAKGIPNFHIFGEVATSEMDPAHTAVNTRVDKLPNVLDFAFARAVIDTVAGKAGTDELAKLFRADPLYEGGAAGAGRNPTFLGNHDAGRFPALLKMFGFKGDDDELLKRDLLGHAMLLTLRGVPTIYSGDEQGFVGKGGDQDARQDMFASKVSTYNEDKLLGTVATTARSNFDTNHPIYREIAKLAHIRTSTPALTRGRQVVRFASDKSGLFAVSRFDPSDGHEVLVVFNTSTQPIEQNVRVETRSAQFATLAGTCPTTAVAPGSVHVSVPALGHAVCDAR